jgi:hypothetical protein
MYLDTLLMGRHSETDHNSRGKGQHLKRLIAIYNLLIELVVILTIFSLVQKLRTKQTSNIKFHMNQPEA